MAISVRSADLSQGPTTNLEGESGARQSHLPIEKVAILHITTYNLYTLSNDTHILNLETELDNKKSSNGAL